jgi:hypothetical protein
MVIAADDNFSDRRYSEFTVDFDVGNQLIEDSFSSSDESIGLPNLSY